jgi:hypothetical protein
MKNLANNILDSQATEKTSSIAEGEATANAFVEYIKTADDNDDVAARLLADLTDLMPTPAWGEVDAAMERLRGFSNILAQGLQQKEPRGGLSDPQAIRFLASIATAKPSGMDLVRTSETTLPPCLAAMFKETVVRDALNGGIPYQMADHLIQTCELTHA